MTGARRWCRLGLPVAAWGMFVGADLSTAGAGVSSQQLYSEHCASCHGALRLGGSGPALLPESLARLSREEAVRTIREGRVATQMPAFGAKLDQGQVESLAAYLYTPSDTPPRWDEDAMRASHRTFDVPLASRPVYDADPLNLFVVVEAGDHHISILDGDRLVPIHRAPTHYALHGGPKFSPDGRYVYLASRDGWISRFDLYTLRYTAEIRAGLNTRNLAVSGDGRYVMIGNMLPGNLVLLDAQDLSLVRIIPAKSKAGQPSRVSAVYQAAPRNSFIGALKDVPEVWEVRYDQSDFPLRRIELGEVLDDFFFGPEYRYLIGAARGGQQGQVLDLQSGRVVARVELSGMPHLGSGITWQRDGHTLLATPNLKEAAVTVIDLGDWSTVKRIPTLGPGFFLRSHQASRYAWVDVFFGPDRDAMQVIDKQTLEVVKTLRPSPGKTSAHVEFTRDGRYALVSLWEREGAIVVYDAKTLEEVKRLPMSKPSGKYNVYNKITLEEGTSH